MSDECTCDCEREAFGECGSPGGGFIDISGAFYVEPSGVYGCVAPAIAQDDSQERDPDRGNTDLNGETS